nr:hypothetical protein [uncultured Oscillibacter sp.]
MEALLVKFSILAGLFGVMGLIGLAALLASVIWLIIRVANFDSMLPALLCVLVAVGLTAGGLFLSPAPEGRAVPPLKAPWETLLEKIAALQDDKEDKEKDAAEDEPGSEPGDSEDGEAPPEMERMEVIRTSAPEREEGESAPEPEPAAPKAENPPEDGGAEPVSAEQSRVLVDEVLDGWRIRLTLPREWKDACVIESNGAYLDFYQKASRLDYGGLVFFLMVTPSPVDFEEYVPMENPQIVAEKDGVALISGGPTDIQFNYEVQEISDEYTRMQAEIPSILETVEFERA